MTIEKPDEFGKHLFMVVIDTVAHHYVYCSYDDVMNERKCLQEMGVEHRIQFIRLVLSDLDTINHMYFC